MFNNFTEEARKVLINAKLEMKKLKHPYVGSEHLLLAILKYDEEIANKFKKYKLTYDVFKNKIIETIGIGDKESEWFLYTPLLKRVLENSILDSKENNSDVTTNYLVSSLLEEGEGVAIRILLNLDIDIETLYEEFNYKIINVKRKGKKLLLEEMGIDLTKKALNNELDPVFGREEEIKRVVEIICRRTKNNPLLVGEAGVGKTAIVEELSRMIVKSEVPTALKNKRIISLDMATMVAGTKYRGEFEERVRKILKEVEENDDIVLFIDEIHTLVGAGGAEGAIDASNIFKPALARNKLRCIGATTTSEYKKYIEDDKALDRRFQQVYIDIPDREMVREILINLKSIYEKYHSVKIDNYIIDSIIDLSEKYIFDRNQPDKAIDILDEVCAKVSLKESKELKEYNKMVKELNNIIKQKDEAVCNNDFKTATIIKNKEFELMDKINNLELLLMDKKVNKVEMQDLANTIHSKTKIPVYEILNDETSLKLMEDKLKDTIIGQDKALEELIKITKKIKLGYKDDNKPYSLLFCGSTGVGKTYLAKTFGDILTPDSVIKVDMSEFSEAHSISKFIGSPPGYIGYADNRNIFEEIKDRPNSVLIIDEIEKAHSNVINLLFQILEDGKVKDSKGVVVRFDNVVIIMTSNIGFDEIKVGFNKNNNNLSKLKDFFSVSFINRIDNILYFNSIDEESILKIISLKLNKFINKYSSKIKVKYHLNIIKEIVEMANYEEFGARKIDKIIKDKIEDKVIDALIANKKNITIKTIKEVVNL